MARPKIKNKKKNTTIYLQPEILEKFKQYCDENDIENYSEHIETLLLKHKDINAEIVIEYLKNIKHKL